MMIKIAALAAIMGLFGMNGMQPGTTKAPVAKEIALGGGTITMLDAPTPPSPYVKSVQFKYNGSFVGAKFKVESADGCTIYTYSGTAGTVHENVLGVMFKGDCGTTRYVDVYYNDNGTWIDYRRFEVNL